MKVTYGERSDQVAMIRAAFRDLLDLKLSDLHSGRIDRWRAQRRSHHPSEATKAKVREVPPGRPSTTTSPAYGQPWPGPSSGGCCPRMPLGKIKRKKEDENAIVRYLSADEETRLRSAPIVRDKTTRAARESANVWRRERGYEK